MALEHEEVRDYYRQRWRAFLVDEFQDTNPVQAEVLELLTQEATLTVVGDENQSIYGFRRADVEVFRRFRDRILSEGGEAVVLATSFRGHSELIGVLNAVFSSVLSETRQDLEAHREEPPHEAPHVRLYAVEAEGRVPKAQLQRAEAAHIARQLREMLDQGVDVYDAAADASRPVRRIVAPIALGRVPLIERRIAGVRDGAKESRSCRPTSELGGPGWYARQACLHRLVERSRPGAGLHHPNLTRECNALHRGRADVG